MKIIEIPNELLTTAKTKTYNPSIVEYNGKIAMFYRYEPSHDFHTELGYCYLDGNWMPIPMTNRKMMFPRKNAKIITMDDPRAFVWQNELWASHSQGELLGDYRWLSHMAISNVDRFGVTSKSMYPTYGHDGSEKNWAPFVVDGFLHMVYMMDPLLVVRFDPNRDIKDRWEAVPCEKQKDVAKIWRVGKPSGGTPLLRKGNEFFGFFHSFTNEDPKQPDHRTYHMGYFSITGGGKAGPWRITKISKKPLMSAKPDAKHDLRGAESTWRPNCIYPCGMVERNGKVYVSMGWQDCRCWIVEFDWKEILKDVMEVPHHNKKSK